MTVDGTNTCRYKSVFDCGPPNVWVHYHLLISFYPQLLVVWETNLGLCCTCAGSYSGKKLIIRFIHSFICSFGRRSFISYFCSSLFWKLYWCEISVKRCFFLLTFKSIVCGFLTKATCVCLFLLQINCFILVNVIYVLLTKTMVKAGDENSSKKSNTR